MRRWLSVAVVFALCLVLSPIQQTNAVNEDIWFGSTAVSEEGSLSAEQVSARADCQFQDVYYKKYPQPLQSVVAALTAGTFSLQNIGRQCVVNNNHGFFTKTTFGVKESAAAYELLIPSGTTYDPAPAGDVVLHIIKQFANDKIYRIAIERDFSQNSAPTVSGVNVKWRYSSIPSIFTDKNGVPISNFLGHAFSNNGEFLVVKFNESFGVVNLKTLDFVPVGRFPSVSWQNAFELAVSNDGKYVSVKNNGLFVYDTTSCAARYRVGQWDMAQTNQAVFSGCTRTQDLLPSILGEMRVTMTLADFKRLQFSNNGARILIGGGVRKITAPPNQSSADAYDWKEYAIAAISYQPQVAGYLAMGDSFSSGEGDIEGHAWYEPGTDEQGNKDTFEGRNLCHLSRRSYPYLIAKQLGILDGSVNVPSTPSAEGLFHSVACSGAVMEKVIGVPDGSFKGIGNEREFLERDNQYSFNYFGQLNKWQPGRVRQLDFLTSQNNAGYETLMQRPEAITLGIGGNDAGFGDIIRSCVMPLTCKYAEPESVDAAALVATIASLKTELVTTYREVIKSSPDSRVYVHGYPNFVQVGGDCALNTPFDNKETVFISEGIKYMNSVVRAAAAEAGASYIDVEDILKGKNLCSSAEQKAFNGLTYGEDTLALPEFIHKGLCLTSGCLGNESFHPNAQGHALYAERILEATKNLTAHMPQAAAQGYPIPQAYFGTNAASIVSAMNNPSLPVVIQQPNRLIKNITETGVTVAQGGFLPSSIVKLVIKSDPVTVGSYAVPPSGQIEITFNFPENIPAGAHELHVTGVSKFGEPIDYFEPILVGVSEEDFDGDNIVNDLDSCPVIINSGIDVDEDGVDDACDESPITPTDERQVEEPAEQAMEDIPQQPTSTSNENEQLPAVLGITTTNNLLAVTNEFLAATGYWGVGRIIIGSLLIFAVSASRSRSMKIYRINKK